MENYNTFFLQQLVPLIYFQIEDSSEVSLRLVETFEQFNIKDSIWDNSIIKNRLLNIKYRIKVIDTDEYKFPRGVKGDTRNDEHSLLSPFNAKSELFPNGILSEKWFKKYIEDLPFAYIVTLKLTDTPEADGILVEKINSLKAAYQKFRINLVVIIVSDSANTNDDDSRTNKLRQLTGLTKLTGLVYLNTAPKTLQRDSDILVTSILSNLKTVANDFYLNIENKVKQRNKKYYSCPSTSNIDTAIELSPIFLETRNLIKQGMISQLAHPYSLDSSLKHLEYAYQNMVELSKESFGKKTFVVPHDEKLYIQFRTLIDIIAFHIVRGYLSLEEPISALKKHKAHIINVLDAFSINDGDNNQWISIQYRWLGELMNLVPNSILNSLNLKSYKRKSKSLKVFQTIGGVQFHETHDYDLITSPEFVFLKSAEFLSQVPSQENRLNYLNDLNDQESVSRQRIQLFLSAKKCLLVEGSNTSSSHNTQDHLQAIKQYISWLTAKEYSKLTDDNSVSKVIEFYELCLAESRIENNKLNHFVLQELLKYYFKSKHINKLLSTIIKLSLLHTNAENFYQIDINDLDVNTNLISINDLDDTDTRLVDVDVLFVSENYHRVGPNESTVYEPCICQLTYKPLVNLGKLKNLLSGSSEDILVELSIKKTEIRFNKQGEGIDSRCFIDVILEQNLDVSQTPHLLQIAEIKENGNISGGKLNIKFKDSLDELNYHKILQFSQIAQKAGSFLIDEINLEIEITISSQGKVLNLSRKESINLDVGHSNSIAHHKWMYSFAADDKSKILRKAVRLFSQAPNSLRVLPLKPNVTVTMESSNANSIIVGEKICVPFSIQYKSPKNQKVDYKRIQLVPKVKIISEVQDQGFVSPLTTLVNWDNLKDDEPLSLQSLVSSEHESKSHILNITILNSSLNANNNVISANQIYRASIELKTLVSEENGENKSLDEDNEIAIYDTAAYTLPVISSPFECKYSIGPRYRNENTVDMPCPFVLSPNNNDSNDSSDKINNYSMPIATRLWLGKLSLVDNLSRAEQSSELEIVETQFTIKSNNPELIVKTDGLSENDDKGTITQLFTTRSKSGFSHRNVMVNSSVSLKWRRKGTEIVNEFKSTEWQIALPLSDPRVLLSLKFEEPNAAKFKYIIENPTPRIFMFTTQLSTDEIDDDIEWNFNDDRNIVPLRQLAFPVLPFNRNIIEFYAKLTNNTTHSVIALPQFKVFDVQYKVALPTLAVCENVVVKNGNSLYLLVNDHSAI